MPCDAEINGTEAGMQIQRTYKNAIFLKSRSSLESLLTMPREADKFIMNGLFGNRQFDWIAFHQEHLVRHDFKRWPNNNGHESNCSTDLKVFCDYLKRNKLR